MENLYYEVALPLPLRNSFTYSSNIKISNGSRVQVPFRNREIVGYVLKKQSSPNVKSIKPITKVLDRNSLIDKPSYDLIHWIANYYKAPIGEIFKSYFPPFLRKGKEIKDSIEVYAITNLGKLASKESFGRAKKQFEALEVFQNQLELSRPGLKANKISKAILDALISKGYLEIKSLNRNELKTNKELNPEAFFELNVEQNKIYKSIKNSSTNLTHLIFGVTGSGKTEIYFHLIRDFVEKGKQVLILVPEIGLTPNLKAEIERRFGEDNVALLHSEMSEKDRAHAWNDINKGFKSILIGTRSAIFTPFKDLGLIVVDEEHDSSYKQIDGFRYSARDVAVYRANLEKIPVIMCSATPSLESLKNCQDEKYCLHKLTQRVKDARQPKFEISDLRSSELKSGLTEYSLNEISKELSKDNQVLVFLNKKGYAPMVFCNKCGWTPECSNCDVSMVYHINPKRLVCHHCGTKHPMPVACLNCNEESLEFFHTGTEKLEEFLKEYFKNTPVIRVDREALGKEQLRSNSVLPDSKEPLILVGTQILAKGHHMPNLTLVVVVDADSGLFSVDHKASERLAQLLIQVSGRAGREDKEGRVILQSFVPEHPFLEKISSFDYDRIANEILEERQTSKLPPFVYQINIHAESLKRPLPEKVLMEISRSLNLNDDEFIGPKPELIEKRKNYFRWVLTLKSENRKKIHALANQVIKMIDQSDYSKNVRVGIDVDPLN